MDKATLHNSKILINRLRTVKINLNPTLFMLISSEREKHLW